MPGSLYDANNVVVGNAVLWTTPWLAPPATKTVVADTVPLFDVTTWETALWVSAGATNEGFKVNVETSTTTVTIEEQSTPVDETIEGKTISIEAELAEDTLQTMSWTWGGGTIVTTAPGAGTPGTSKMSLSDNLKYVTAVLEMRNFKGLARRIYIPKMSIGGSGETSFRRSADKRLYPVRLSSLCKPSDIQIIEITAPAA
jgi:hypothetical protein